MKSTSKQGSLNTTTNLESIVHPPLECDHGDLMKSRGSQKNNEWLWVLKSGKMVEIDNRGRPLQAAECEESEEIEKKVSISRGLDCWIG